MLELRFDVESAYALEEEPPSERNWAKWTDETLNSVTQICSLLERQQIPASFFIVGLLLERIGGELSSLLKENPLFDVDSHTYSHMHIKEDDPQVIEQFQRELEMTSDLLEQHFGVRPLGFCAPGNFYQGLRGCRKHLEILWDHGIRYVGSDGWGPADHPIPAPFNQPYWYSEEGFPDLLEVPINGWHCNMLFNTGRQNDDWQPAVGFPDGTLLETLPVTIEEGYQVRAREFEYALDRQMIYAPAYHPWSVCRFDPQLQHLERLIKLAKKRNLPVVNCRQVYTRYVDQKR